MTDGRSRKWPLLLLLLLSVPVNAQSYRILLTNDDGIESPLLAVLKQELESLPGVEVVVVAPHENQSGSSNSSIGTPLTVDRIEKDGSFFGYAVHGRPADAVTFGMNMPDDDQNFDLVVSGINDGANVGDVSHGSGTVGAAMRAQLLGLPSIAVSQGGDDLTTAATAARLASQLVERYRRDGAPQGIVLSINVPEGEIKGTQVRPMGESYLGRSPYVATANSDNSVTYESRYVIQRASDPGSDTYAYQDGYITVTPLKFDWTAHEFIEEVRSWNLE